MGVTDTKEIYNDFENYPLFAYNCLAYLVENEDYNLLWKLLYYNDADAWKNDVGHPNLTIIQKRNLIYAGQNDGTSYRAFIDFGLDDVWKVEACQIRISPIGLYPKNHIIGRLTMGFEVYSHFAINTLSNYTTRIDTITQLFVKAFNGTSVKGIGRLYFNSRASAQCGTSIIGAIPFKGKRTIMCNWIT